MNLGTRSLSDFTVKDTQHAEFQRFGKVLQEWSGEEKFPINLFLKFPMKVILRAFYIADKKGVKSTKYLFGIAKNLK